MALEDERTEREVLRKRRVVDQPTPADMVVPAEGEAPNALRIGNLECSTAHILEGLSCDAAGALLSRTVCKAYEKGQMIVGPCTAEGALFMVIEGSTYLCGLVETGREVILRRYGESELFGLSFLDPDVVPADFPDMYVKAGYSSTRVATFPIDSVRDLLSSVPEFALRMIAVQGNHVAKYAKQCFELMSGRVRMRLCCAILDIAAGDPRRRVHATHEELAQMIGATRQQVTEALCDLRREGLITYERCGPIELLAPEERIRKRMSKT